MTFRCKASNLISLLSNTSMKVT